MAKEAVPPLSLDSAGVKAGTTEAEKKQSGWRADLGRLRRLSTYVKPYKGRLITGLLLLGPSYTSEAPPARAGLHLQRGARWL